MQIDPHSNWYNITIPEIDIRIVKKELLLVQDASEYSGISENIIKDLIETGKLSSYFLKDQELISKSELEQVLQT